jgi:DNA-binding transcriptional LysR family regulator
MAARRMSLRHIEAFRTVMITGSMTEAARRMHTSQPHISRLIAQLEEIAQFPLFDRNGSRLTPTLDGSRFYQEVEKTFIGLDGLQSAVVNIRAFGAGRLSVAAMPRLAGGLLTRIVARFKAAHPEVMVSIHSGTASSVHDWVKSGMCDAGLAMLYTEPSDIQVEPILSTRCVAVLPRAHRLAKRARLEPADFAGEPFISFPRGSALGSRIDQIFSAAGVERKIAVETDLGASVCTLVAAGLGLGLINPLAAREESEISDIEVRPFTPALPVTIALLYPPYHARSRLVDAFDACARALMAEEPEA